MMAGENPVGPVKGGRGGGDGLFNDDGGGSGAGGCRGGGLCKKGKEGCSLCFLYERSQVQPSSPQGPSFTMLPVGQLSLRFLMHLRLYAEYNDAMQPQLLSH